MTGEQKQQIYILRKRKKSFAEISEIIGIPRNTIKTFCWRSGLTDADLEQGLQNRGYRGFCKNCGKELEQKSKSRPRYIVPINAAASGGTSTVTNYEKPRRIFANASSAEQLSMPIPVRSEFCRQSLTAGSPYIKRFLPLYQ